MPGVTGSNVDPNLDNAYTEISRGIATAWVIEMRKRPHSLHLFYLTIDSVCGGAVGC